MRYLVTYADGRPMETIEADDVEAYVQQLSSQSEALVVHLKKSSDNRRYAEEITTHILTGVKDVRPAPPNQPDAVASERGAA